MEFCAKATDDKGFFFAPVNSFDGIQKTYPKLFDSASSNNDTNFLHLKKRLQSMPKMIYDIILLLKYGMRFKITYATESLTGVDETLKKLDVKVNNLAGVPNLEWFKV